MVLNYLAVPNFYVQNIPVLNYVPLGGSSNQEWLAESLISVCAKNTDVNIF